MTESIRTTARDSMMRLPGKMAVVAAVLAVLPASAAEVQLQGSFEPGGMVVGIAPPGSTASVDGQSVRVSEDGRFVFGLGRDERGPVAVTVNAPGGAELRRKLEIPEREYDIQRIDGLPDDKVSPGPETMERIRSEQAAIDAARAKDSPGTHFAGDWVWPVTGRITGVYGSQRILNDEPRSPHFGLDVAAPEGTPVGAPASGVVTLARRDMYFSGHTVIIDHGHGVSSTLIHFSELLVDKGDEVAAGETIARVGATGRATGPHVHWGVNWFDTRLDPRLLVGAMAE